MKTLHAYSAIVTSSLFMTVACGGGGSSAAEDAAMPTDGGASSSDARTSSDAQARDGGDAGSMCEPQESCEARGAICGTHVDERCGTIDCGPCRFGSTTFEGTLPSLELDGEGVAHVVYALEADATGELRHARIVDGELQGDERIAEASLDPADRPPAFVLDEAGTPHVAWRSAGEVHYATRTAGQWTVEVLGAGNLPDLAVDADGTVHVVYAGEGSSSFGQYGSLRRATKSAGAWTDEEVAPDLSSWPSLALAPDGSPRLLVAVPRPYVPALELGTWTGEAWTFEELFSSPDLNGDPLIADLEIHTDGTALSVIQLTTRLERIAQADGRWRREVLQSDDVSPLHSMALDSYGATHVVFFGREGLYYAGLSLGDRCGDGATDIEIGSHDEPHIVYGCGTVVYLTPVGSYPPSYFETCDSVATRLCQFACDCRTDADCSYAYESFDTTFGPESACPNWVRQDLCNSRTIDPSLVVACDEALAASDGSCDGERYVLPDACGTVLVSQ